jgi:uncharacterized protein with gpF-like domain
MPRYNLAQLARRQKNIRRRSITLPEIAAPQMMAQDLFASCYRPIIDLWASATPTIVAEYERTLSVMTQDSAADIQGQIDRTAAEAYRIALTLTPSLRSWALKVERYVRTRWTNAVRAATSVDLSTMLGPEDVRETLEAYLQWNADLIADVSGEIRKRIADEVFSGLTQNKPVREVAKAINEKVALGRARSQRIAADQTSKISTSLAAERRREAGLTVFAWHHSAKKHPRKDHQARDGLYYSELASDVGRKVDGKVVHQAPERSERAGQLPFCGCRERGVLAFEWDE